MCGIVGYLGKRQCSEILTSGLEKLEYRGYDSAGISVISGETIKTRKVKGRLLNLKEEVLENPVKGTVGIGHTRWATHGEPSVKNSHPHLSEDNKIAVVHNGIIENYMELREFLKDKGFTLVSDTDTEVIPNLISYYYKGDLLHAVSRAIKDLKGSYAISVIAKDHPMQIVSVRKDSPLIVGLKESKNEFFIASDIPAILKETRDIYLLEDNEIAVLTPYGVKLYDGDKNSVEKEVFHVTWDADASEKGGYDYFMLKEIMEQPKVIGDTMKSRIKLKEPISLDNIKMTQEDIEKINKVYIVACGTAYHAGLVGKYAIENLAKISVENDIASEFRYRSPLLDDKTLLIVLSQSGETADTLAAMKLAKEKGAKIIAVTNVVGSTISREADEVFYTHAGPEIAVASTKAYTTQLVAMITIAMYLGETNKKADKEYIEKLKEEMLNLPEKVQEVLKFEDEIKEIAKVVSKEKDVFFLGRGIDYAVALEGSLKLKEISYIHSEAYAGGELKHGTIALVEKGTNIIALMTQEDLLEKMFSNVKEVITRGAKIFGVINEENKDITSSFDKVVKVPKVSSLVSSVISVIPLQLLAYYVAINKDCDVDKPRNLAKSVTVE